MNIYVRTLLAVALLLVCHGKSNAAVTVFHDEITFLASNPIVSTETFDGFPSPTSFGSLVTIDSVTYETAAPGDWRAGIALGGTVSQPNDFGTNDFNDNVLTFGPGGFLHAIGFWFGSGGILPVPHWEIVVEETDGSVTIEDISFQSSQEYFGFSSPLGIRMATLRDFEGDGGGSNWSIDNVSRSKILPEPSTFALAVLGLIGLLTYSRRVRR